jgi:hypothetical protein
MWDKVLKFLGAVFLVYLVVVILSVIIKSSASQEDKTDDLVDDVEDLLESAADANYDVYLELTPSVEQTETSDLKESYMSDIVAETSKIYNSLKDNTYNFINDQLEKTERSENMITMADIQGWTDKRASELSQYISGL